MEHSGESGTLRGRKTRVEETRKWNGLIVRGLNVTTRPRKDYWFVTQRLQVTFGKGLSMLS